MKKIKKIVIYPNQLRDEGYAYSRRLVGWLSKREIAVAAPKETAEALQLAVYEPGSGEEADLAIVLGGDGTALRCAKFLLGTQVPIWGINLGTLGYLNEVEPLQMEEALEKVLSGAYRIEERIMLEARVYKAGQPAEEPAQRLYAVNDFVLHRSLQDGLLTVMTEVNEEHLADFRADGVIVASPCGSTAYNFSAGGPIINPVADNLILTPICSHSMLDRSIVLMGSDVLQFEVGASGKGCKAQLSADGWTAAELSAGSRIQIYKSQYTFRMLQMGQRSFYETLQAKMRP